MHCLRKQQTIIEVFYVMCCSFLHNLEQRLSAFARSSMKKYSIHGNSSEVKACYNYDEISALYCMKIH